MHGHGRIEHDEVLLQLLDNESNFLCVSFKFANAVVKKKYSKYFVWASVVSDLMLISTKQKKSMIGNR